jgi:hypothetical protein
MRQALHIFRKDVRYLRLEILLVVLLSVVLAAVRPDWIDSILLPAAAFLTARLIQAEPIPGDRQFWITRPYRWQSLLGAKVLFIVVFVNLPIMLAQWWIVARAGFPIAAYLPGLLYSQLIRILALAVPVAALAALTPGLVSFLFSMLALAALWSAASVTGDNWPFSIAWIRVASAGAVVAVIGICIFCDQYRRRATLRNRAIAIAGLVLLSAGAYLLPWTSAWAVQARLGKHMVDESAIQIAVDPGAVRFHPVQARTWSNVDVFIPITIGPVPEQVQLLTNALTVTYEGADGQIWRSDIGGVRESADKGGRIAMEVNSKMGHAFFQREQEKPLTIRGSIFMTMFGDSRQQTIALSDEPVNALDGLQCYQGAIDQFECRRAFTWPSALVYGQYDGHMNPLRTIIAYPPIPFSTRLDPIERSWAPPTPHSKEVTVVVKKPLEHIRRDFELHGVRVIASPQP